jgi:microcompartment protein CcmL/EutN
MKKYPAIALLEINSIANGIVTADAMTKKAPVSVLKSGTVHNGKFLILVGGSVAAVEEAYTEGLNTASDFILDKVFLPRVHEQVSESILGKRRQCNQEALAIIEMNTVASNLYASDAAVKGAYVNILELRVADDIGGKAFTLFNGTVEEVETTVDITRNFTTNPENIFNCTIIPKLSAEMINQINQTTVFHKSTLFQLTGEEI